MGEVLDEDGGVEMDEHAEECTESPCFGNCIRCSECGRLICEESAWRGHGGKLCAKCYFGD